MNWSLETEKYWKAFIKILTEAVIILLFYFALLAFFHLVLTRI